MSPGSQADDQSECVSVDWMRDDEGRALPEVFVALRFRCLALRSDPGSSLCVNERKREAKNPEERAG
jgi:hypothetical protein